MKTSDHQRRAANCRHAQTTAAKLWYQHYLSNRLKESQRLAGDPPKFASCQRRHIDDDTKKVNREFGLNLKISTVTTWLREWSKSAQGTKQLRTAHDEDTRRTRYTEHGLLGYSVAQSLDRHSEASA
jgi:hypothetical protein